MSKELPRHSRSVMWLDDLRRDVIYGVRTLLRARSFTLVAVLTLAIGISAVTVIYSVLRNVALDPFPYSRSDRLVNVVLRDGSGRIIRGPYFRSEEFLDYQEQTTAFEDVVGTSQFSAHWTSDAGAERLALNWMTPNGFDFLGVRPRLGRVFDYRDVAPGAPPVAVMNHRAWVTRFGADPGVIGRTLVLDGQPYTVIGVMPPRFEWNIADLWLPAAMQRSDDPQTPRGTRAFQAHLRPGVTAAEAEAQLNVVGARRAAERPNDYPPGFRFGIIPVVDWVVREFRGTLYALFGAVSLLLVIACCNVANMLLARATIRERELTIRAAIGASRGRIVRMLITDSVVLTLAAGLAGLAIADTGIHVARAVAPALPHMADASLNPDAWLFAAAAAIVSGVLVSVPALFASLSSRAGAVRVDTRRAGRDRRTSRVRAVLVAAEFALALPLLVSACWFLQSLWRLQGVDPGFTAAGAVTLNVELAGPRYADGQARAAFWQRLEDRAREMPGISAAGFGGNVPPDDPEDVNNFDLIDRPARGGAEPTAPWNVIRPGFLDALGVRLLEGRVFTTAEYTAGATTALVSASWARRYFRGESALGRKMVEGGCTTCPLTEVVGVVSDVKYQGLDGNNDAVYQTADPADARSFHLVARTSASEDDAIRALTNAVQSIDADVLVESSTFRARLGDALNEPRNWTALVGGFATVAGLLAALGVFGLMSYVVGQQRREIGVRLALGATPAAMTMMVVTRGVRYAIAGSAAGAGLAVLAGRWLLSSSFGIRTADGLVVLAIAMALALIGAVTSWWPGRQAGRVGMLEAMSVE